jgi:predicted AlkP superfamily pyrophosphatase or phosphodiesterase
MRMTLRCFLFLMAAAVAHGQVERRAVLIDLDGVRRDTFTQLYASGALPNFARIFGDAVWFDKATTVTPSVTMAAQASIATGVLPARHGIVGNQWYERDGNRSIDYMNANGLTCVYGFTVLAGSMCSTGLGNRHLQAQTMYEAAAAKGLSSLVVFNQYWRGALRPAAPTSAEGYALLRGSNAVDYQVFDELMTARAIREMQATGLPAVLTVYYAGADGIAHKEGIAAQAPYLAGEVDPQLGRILNVIEGLDPEWRAHTMFVLTSDHGRTDLTPHPEDVTLAADLAKALPPTAHIALNGGVAYIYSEPEDREMAHLTAARLMEDPRIAAAVSSVTRRDPAQSPRAGELTVTLRPGHYFGNPGHGSQHGGVADEDRAVPLVVAMPGVAGARSNAEVSITQIARTIAEFVGFDMTEASAPLPVQVRFSSATRK